MNTGWVIDSSIGFAWIHPHQATNETDRLLNEVEKGTRVVVPTLWFLEMANGLLVLQRRKRITQSERKVAIDILSKLNFTVDEELWKVTFGRISELAEDYSLTIYDTAYLELALRRNMALASRDNALTAAAKKAGAKTL